MSDNQSSILQDSALKPGTRLQSEHHVYTIEEALGSGAFGIVYRASSVVYDGNIPRKCQYAIKEFFYFQKGCYRDDDGSTMIAPKTTRTEVNNSARDFELEARRLHGICALSDRIVRVNEIFRANDTFYYVMEYLDGGDLESYVRENGGRLDEQHAVAIIREIAGALKILHSEPHRLLHLDLKPSNIIMKRDEFTGTEYPVLIDFGTAVHFDRSGKATVGSALRGFTYGYAPYEQTCGTSSFNPRLDIYALGATLFFLLTGKDPDAADQINPEWINRYLPTQLSAPTRMAIINAMAFDPNTRTPSIERFLEDLDSKGPAVVPPPPSPGDGVITDDDTPEILLSDDDVDIVAVSDGPAPLIPPAPPVPSTPPAPPVPPIQGHGGNRRFDINATRRNYARPSRRGNGMNGILIGTIVGIVVVVATVLIYRGHSARVEQARRDSISTADSIRAAQIRNIFESQTPSDNRNQSNKVKKQRESDLSRRLKDAHRHREAVPAEELPATE